MYRNAADALSTLLLDEGGKIGTKITGMKEGIVRLANGIKYFAVEVTAADGVQYGISAYGEEAEELYTVATIPKMNEASVPIVLSK